jgi:hypothetical protein
MTKQTLEVKEDPETGNLFLEFPVELLSQMGWAEGDDLEWIDNKDGSWSIKKKDE